MVRTIAAPQEDVWRVLLDVGRCPELYRSVTSVEMLTAGPVSLGSRWRATRSVFGRTEAHEFTVTELDPPHRVVFTAESGGVPYRIDCTLTPSGDHTPSRPRTRIVSRYASDQPDSAPHLLWRMLGNIGSLATEEMMAQDLSDIADAVERPDTTSMALLHRLFNRELAAGADLIRGVRDGDVYRAKIVADHLRTVLDTLVDHHHGEDVLIWPLLAERTALPADLEARMNAQHAEVHAAIDRVRVLVDRWVERADTATRDELAAVAEPLAQTLRDHLEAEENEILPLVEEHLTRAEYDRLVAHGRDTLPREKAATLVQLILEGANAQERARMLREFPPARQLLIRTLGARQYRNYVRRLRDSSV